MNVNIHQFDNDDNKDTFGDRVNGSRKSINSIDDKLLSKDVKD